MESEEIIGKLWKRIDECLDDGNGLSCLRRLVNNANTLTNYLESLGMLTEANKALYSIQSANKKINLGSHSRSVDNALVFIFLKMLTTIPSRTKAYKLGLIDKDGRLIKQPVTKEENDSISNLDLLMFKIRKWLSSRLQYLSTVSWIKGAGNNVRLQNYFANTDVVSKQYQVQRINADLERILNKG